MIIGKKDTSKKPYVIAEAGTGHRGKVRTALKLCNRATQCGADAIKFQIFVLKEELFCPLEGDEYRWKMWNDSVMPLSDWRKVRERCRELGIHFGASVFQHSAIDLLKKLKPDFYKVASRAIDTFPYDQLDRQTFVSTGMGWPTWSNVYPLRCVMKYPTPLKLARWIPAQERPVGLSDHSGTPWPAVDAMSRGCEVIEVHFGINMTGGNDDRVALTSPDLKLVCEARDAIAQMRAC